MDNRSWWCVVQQDSAKKLQQTVIGYVALGILILSALMVAVTLVPLAEHIEEKERRAFQLAVGVHGHAIDEYFLRAKHVAAQITSRSQMRKSLEAYNRGDITLEEYVETDVPRMLEALEMSPEIAGIVRMDKRHQPLFSLRTPIPKELWPPIDDDISDVTIHQFVTLNERLYFLISAPIMNVQQRRIGTDLLLFDSIHLQEMLRADGLFDQQLFLGAIDEQGPATLLQIGAEGTALVDAPPAIHEVMGRVAQRERDIVAIEGNGIVGYTTVDRGHWVMLMTTTNRHLYDSINAQVGLIIGVMLIVVVVGTYGTIRIVRPLAEMLIISPSDLDAHIADQTRLLEKKIEEHERTAIALRTSNERYERAVRAGRVTVWDWTIRHVPMNGEREDVAGTTLREEEEFDLWSNMGDWQTSLHPDDVTRINDALHAYLRGETPVYEVEYRMVHEDGSVRWFFSRGTAIRDGYGKPICLSGMDIDITERKRIEEELHESRALFQEILDYSPTNIYVKNANGQFLLVNKQLAHYLRREISDIVGRNERDIFTPEIIESWQKEDHYILQTGATLERDEVLLLDGKVHHLLLLKFPIYDTHGNIYATAGISTDITDRVRAEIALQQERDFAESLIDTARIIVLVLDTEGRIVRFNRYMEELSGYRLGEVQGSRWIDVFCRDHDRQHLQFLFENALRDIQISGVVSPIVMRDGQEREIEWYDRVLRDSQGIVVGLLAVGLDITDRRRVEEQLRHQALHDPLTGLPNRALFLELLEHAMRRNEQGDDHRFAVLFLDLDQFKVINDSLGYLAGDQLLTTVADRLRKRLRGCDTVARFGSDEFVILLEDMNDVLDAIVLTHRLQRDIAAPIHLNEHKVFTTATIGIAMGLCDYHHPTDILRDADIALHAAKARGPGTYAVFDATMHMKMLNRLHIDEALRQAIDQGELCVYYQPIVALSSGRIIGFESLVRWQHPKRGLLSPGEFIPIAEETGVIVALDWWVVYRACEQMQAWHKQFPELRPLTIGVNFSVQSFLHSDIVARMYQVLEETGLDVTSLKIEITENTMMDHAEGTILTLKRLRDLGVQLCIDDFGTGFSSLRYLHRFPIQTLKIDRAFITNLNIDSESTAITQSIISLSHTLGKRVIAEGIETIEQLTYLQSLACDYGQGYLFSEPVDAVRAKALLMQESLQPIQVIESATRKHKMLLQR